MSSRREQLEDSLDKIQSKIDRLLASQAYSQEELGRLINRQTEFKVALEDVVDQQAELQETARQRLSYIKSRPQEGR